MTIESTQFLLKAEAIFLGWAGNIGGNTTIIDRMNDRPIQIERFLEIDRLLRERARQTSDSLAQYLEVSSRTIRSDLNWLRYRYYAPMVYYFLS